jgi:hypothetical protein
MEQHAQGNLPLERLIKVYESKDFLQAFQDIRTAKSLSLFSSGYEAQDKP